MISNRRTKSIRLRDSSPAPVARIDLFELQLPYLSCKTEPSSEFQIPPTRRPVTQPSPKTIGSSTASEQGLFYLFGGGAGAVPATPAVSREACATTQGKRACHGPAVGLEILFGKTAFSTSDQGSSKVDTTAEKPTEALSAKQAAQPSGPAASFTCKSPPIKDNTPARIAVRRATPEPVCITTAPTLQRICQNLGLNPGKEAPPRKSLPALPGASSSLFEPELASESKASWRTKGKAWKATISQLDDGLGRWRDHVQTGKQRKKWREEEDRKEEGKDAPESAGEASARLVTDASFEEKTFVEDRMFAVSGIHLFGRHRAQEAYQSLQTSEQGRAGQFDSPDGSSSVGAFETGTADQAGGISPSLSFSSRSSPISPRSQDTHEAENEARSLPAEIRGVECSMGISSPPARANSPPDQNPPTGWQFLAVMTVPSFARHGSYEPRVFPAPRENL